VDTADSYSDEGGEQASANSRMYLSTSWRNFSMPSWYMVMIRDPSMSWMISVVPWREKERGDIAERRGRRQEFWRNTCLRTYNREPTSRKASMGRANALSRRYLVIS
jgi:hypothetical protein